MIHIGIDLHAPHFSMAVLNQDNGTMFEKTLLTSSQNLRAAIGAFSETKNVVFEVTCLLNGTSWYVNPTACAAMAGS